jgi:pilus assembly protein Flp/PilA
MNTLLLRTYLFMKQMLEHEHGQDMVEYALVVALIAFGAVTGMQHLSSGINKAFSTISSTLTTDI